MPEPRSDYSAYPQAIRHLLEFPSEGLRTEYKEGFSWALADGPKKMKIAKSIAAFGNSGGGRLLIGVDEETKQVNGSLPLDHGFDPTSVGNDLNRWFQPLPLFSILVLPRPAVPALIVISVSEFEYEPHICSGGSGPITQGGVYVRTIDGQSKCVDSTTEMRHILRLAAKKLRAEAFNITGAAASGAFSPQEIADFRTDSRTFFGVQG